MRQSHPMNGVAPRKTALLPSSSSTQACRSGGNVCGLDGPGRHEAVSSLPPGIGTRNPTCCEKIQNRIHYSNE